MKLIKKSLTEKQGLEFMVVYTNNTEDVIMFLNEKTYSDVESIRELAYEKLLKADPNASDDFWIDDITVEKGDVSSKIDWKTILTGDTYHLDQDMVDLIFDDPDVSIKIQYLIQNRGQKAKDINESMLEDVNVYDASRDRKVEGNFKSFYPDGWLEEYSEILFPSLVKELQNVNGESYFDFARLFSDMEVNGDFDSDWIDDYFVTYNI